MERAEAVTPFEHRADERDLEELRRRLRATIWPDEPAGLGWSAGVDLTALRDLCAYWADGFDWRAAEERLNRLPRFRTSFDGLGVHLVHARPAAGAGEPLPLLLAHGWPDSFWRYAEVVPLLVDPAAHGADPDDAFEVVVPDMPGFGFSDAAPEDLAPPAVAALWARLMDRLGHRRFAASGGDIGSSVVRWLALDHPDRVIAVHRTDAVLTEDFDRAALTPEEQRWMAGRDRWEVEEGAYGAVQSTKPQSLAVGLTDSPAGLAAWLLEKLHGWSGRGADGASLLDRDAVLTDITLFWLTGTIGSSMRMYRATEGMPASELARVMHVPTGYTLFPEDVEPPAPEAWLRRTTTDLRSVSRPERGGHFAPVEDPERYAQELRDFFRPFRAR